jgi:hypothetical protein
MKEKLSKLFAALKQFPKGKSHLDFITALLSIPVLLSIIYLNYSNIQNSKKNNAQAPVATPAPTSAEKQIIIVPQSSSPSAATTTVPSPSSAVCKADIGPIEISSPQEGETITDNPVCLTINYSDANYCSVVWSYKINGGPWSDYGNDSPCIYNLPYGNVKFELRVQSTVSQNKTTSLTRNFIYKGQSVVTPTPTETPNASPSATIR